VGEAELVLRQIGMMEFRLDDVCHGLIRILQPCSGRGAARSDASQNRDLNSP
jgi:hypothetical protein